MSSYQLPEIIWELVFDKQDSRPYEYISRKPGEEENIFPRPLGTERTLLCDTPPRLVRYSYVTSEYILGTQMDHPQAIHSHLSVASRYHGIIMRTTPDAYIYPVTFEKDQTGQLVPTGRLYRSVQFKNVLITQQALGYTQVNPEWFPRIPHETCAYGLYFGKEFTQLDNNGSWIFVKEGETLVALRPAFGTWEKQSAKTLILEKPYAPIIIHAGLLNKHKTFAKFKEYILNNSLEVHDIVTTGDHHTITYTTGEGDKIYFNAANNEPPRVNGHVVDYVPRDTFCSPHMQSAYEDAVVRVIHGNHEIELNFS